MRGTRILGRHAFAAKGILTCRDSFQVVWIHTIADPAQMVYLEPFRDRTNEVLVCPSVSKDVATVIPKVPVVDSCATSLPQPAPMTVPIDLLSEPHFGGHSHAEPP